MNDGVTPALAYEYEALAPAAAQLLANRAAAYPAAVEAGRMSQAQADEGLRAMASVSADWQRTLDLHAGRAVDARDVTATRAEKLATLEQALARPRALFKRATVKVRDTLGPDSQRWRWLEAGHWSHLDIRREVEEGALAHPAVTAWLAAERHLAAVEALHWHAAKPLGPMFFAELTAELRERGRADERVAA